MTANHVQTMGVLMPSASAKSISFVWRKGFPCAYLYTTQSTRAGQWIGPHCIACDINNYFGRQLKEDTDEEMESLRAEDSMVQMLMADTGIQDAEFAREFLQNNAWCRNPRRCWRASSLSRCCWNSGSIRRSRLCDGARCRCQLQKRFTDCCCPSSRCSAETRAQTRRPGCP
jgi:hypothetical protein